MSKWSDFYRDRVNNYSYEAYFAQRYAPFLTCITDRSRLRRTILEVGAGIGTVSKMLSGPRIAAEPDPDQRRLLLQNTHGLKVWSLTGAEAVKAAFGNVLVHSHGLLEHLTPAQVRAIVEADFPQIHYVPTNKYERPSFGDERLRSVDWWVEKFGPWKYWTFNGGYDLVMEF